MDVFDEAASASHGRNDRLGHLVFAKPPPY